MRLFAAACVRGGCSRGINRARGVVRLGSAYQHRLVATEPDDVPDVAPHSATNEGAAHRPAQSQPECEAGLIPAALTIIHPDAVMVRVQGTAVGSRARFGAMEPRVDVNGVKPSPTACSGFEDAGRAFKHVQRLPLRQGRRPLVTTSNSTTDYVSSIRQFDPTGRLCQRNTAASTCRI